jgi:hypothetical protein
LQGLCAAGFAATGSAQLPHRSGIALSNARPITIRENAMSLATIILIVLVLMLVGAIPTWPHSRSWGYGPSGGIGLVAVIVIVLLLMGRL